MTSVETSAHSCGHRAAAGGPPGVHLPGGPHRPRPAAGRERGALTECRRTSQRRRGGHEHAARRRGPQRHRPGALGQRLVGRGHLPALPRRRHRSSAGDVALAGGGLGRRLGPRHLAALPGPGRESARPRGTAEPGGHLRPGALAGSPDNRTPGCCRRRQRHRPRRPRRAPGRRDRQRAGGVRLAVVHRTGRRDGGPRPAADDGGERTAPVPPRRAEQRRDPVDRRAPRLAVDPEGGRRKADPRSPTLRRRLRRADPARASPDRARSGSCTATTSARTSATRT